MSDDLAHLRDLRSGDVKFDHWNAFALEKLQLLALLGVPGTLRRPRRG
ncbi:hypothetical protein IVA78_25145 [Bradyrhizobium sp. 137]|nr:hypothetical protein [Bradyrhizobium sp. 137]MCK1758369.1 hypothetical protein [Bradyrhizobium sp. 137]